MTAALLLALALAQDAGPKLLRQVEPQYTEEARAAKIKGNVSLDVEVDEQGSPGEIRVVKPLGHGLDQKAREAVAKWKFSPATKAGQPVKSTVRVEINFRLLGPDFEDGFAKALAGPVGDSAKEMAKMSAQGYAPAQYRYGLWMIEGSHGVTQDRVAGMELMKRAALSGEPDAEVYLAQAYQRGELIQRDPDQARVYFGACAMHRVAACQYQIGQELYQMRGRVEHDHIEAVAMLELASEAGNLDAEAFLDRVAPRLSVGQRKAVDTRKTQIRGGR